MFRQTSTSTSASLTEPLLRCNEKNEAKNISPNQELRDIVFKYKSIISNDDYRSFQTFSTRENGEKIYEQLLKAYNLQIGQDVSCSEELSLSFEGWYLTHCGPGSRLCMGSSLGAVSGAAVSCCATTYLICTPLATCCFTLIGGVLCGRICYSTCKESLDYDCVNGQDAYNQRVYSYDKKLDDHKKLKDIKNLPDLLRDLMNFKRIYTRLYPQSESCQILGWLLNNENKMGVVSTEASKPERQEMKDNCLRK
ncbi:MAG TPA: hypothetical protein VLI69_04790 [Gammaproteobacteria bacterium]|nr:hypothetical protein [Gammaproteobacteria bacterium]